MFIINKLSAKNNKMDPENLYNNNIEAYSKELAKLKKKYNLWSYIRIAVFIGGFAFITYLSDIITVDMLSLSVLIIIILLGISVVIHQRVSDNIKSTKDIIKINKNEIAVINQEENIYTPGYDFHIEHQDISKDLDLFGEMSVFHFINRASTYFGNNKIKDFIINNTKEEEIKLRQNAIEELSEDNTWRQNYQKELIDISASNKFTSLLSFAKDRSFISSKKNTFYILFTINLILVSIFTLSIFVFSQYSFTIFMLLFIYSSVINVMYSSRVNKIHQSVSENGKNLLSFYNALQLIESKKWESELLIELATKANSFSSEVKKLKILIQKFDYRLNMVVGTILNILFLWDLRIISKLDKWREKNNNLENRLQIMGEFEALNSFAILKFNNPNNCTPIISTEEFEIKAVNLFHPLISKNEVVSNNYSISKKSKLDIITGPNMSGKSTFLRSIAINMLLAKSGSSVFADKFIFTPSKVLTYLHITDSVKEKISTFRAEIIKLKSILDEIKTSDIPTFFILDEILRGTNSESKFKGSVAVAKKLLELKSSGIIATHDVKLGYLENDFSSKVSNYSFDFILDKNDELVYDYKLKSGINTKVNADIVLKELGLVL